MNEAVKKLTNKSEETTDSHMDTELWEISSVEDFIYKKNSKGDPYINSQIIYRSIHTNKAKKENGNLDILFNKVIGNIYDSNDKIIQSNCKKNTEKLIFEVLKSNLNMSSKRLYHYDEFGLEKESHKSHEDLFGENKPTELANLRKAHLLLVL